MSQIIKLLHVHIESFKSFKQPTDIEFPAEGGFFFLGGRNEVEPRLGANGAGKSSLWDAIFWCLYGTSIKGDKASELVSWKAKRPLVALELEIDCDRYLIERVGSPEKIMASIVGGDPEPSPITQPELDQLLGLTKARFAQSILFGQGAKMFLDLSVPERGALLDEILDLSLWERLAKHAGDKAKEHELEQVDARRDIAFVSGKLEGLVDTDKLQEQEDAWAAGLQADLSRLCDELETEQNHLGTLQAELTEVKPPAPFEHAALLKKEREQVSDLGQQMKVCEHEIREAQRLAEFYRTHNDCPTCKQSLSDDFIKAQSNEILAQIEALQSLHSELNDELTVARALVQQYEAQESALVQANLMHARARAQQEQAIKGSERNIENMLGQMARIEAQLGASPFAKQMAELAVTKANLEAELAAHKTRETDAAAAHRHMDYWRQGFKKVKLFIIKRALAMLELETAAAAAALGLPGWSIKYVTEVETKSGSLKSGVQILVSSPTVSGNWSLWSGGEGQRIRIAISRGLSNMIQRMAGVDYRFEVWDEPTNWLSPEGIADLMECLHNYADLTNKALWIIDHRALDATSFNLVWIMRKTINGSQLEIL